MSETPDPPDGLDLPLRPNGGSEPKPETPDEPRESHASGAGPYCAYCGSSSLHESTRGGMRESLLRWMGAGLYRCNSCGRRFGFTKLGRPGRHRRTHRTESAHTGLFDNERELAPRQGRRRAVGVLTTLFAALVSYALASWLINRSEQRRLEQESQPTPQD
jgi:hypothetical protein